MAIDVQSENRHIPQLDGSGLRIGIICARFNDFITLRLLEGAVRASSHHNVSLDNLYEIWVPGAFEIPYAAKKLAQGGRVDAVVCFGAVIRGETSHYDFVAGGCAQGIQQAQLETGIPIIFGVLTTENLQQACDRSEESGGHNVGYECIETAIEMVQITRHIQTFHS